MTEGKEVFCGPSCQLSLAVSFTCSFTPLTGGMGWRERAGVGHFPFHTLVFARCVMLSLHLKDWPFMDIFVYLDILMIFLYISQFSPSHIPISVHSFQVLASDSKWRICQCLFYQKLRLPLFWDRPSNHSCNPQVQLFITILLRCSHGDFSY